jgi:hypothetical protein
LADMAYRAVYCDDWNLIEITTSILHLYSHLKHKVPKELELFRGHTFINTKY